MEFKVITASFPEWEPFCTQYSGLLFHRAAWQQVLQSGLPAPSMYCTLWEDKQLILGLPVFVMDYKIFKILHAAIPYGTIIGDYQALPYFFAALYDFLHAQRFHVLYLGGSYPELPHLDIPGHTPKYQPAHLLSLRNTSAEDIQQQYKPYTRRDIRRAERFGIKVEKISSRCEVEDFYLLYLCTMKRNQAIAKYPKKFIYSIYDYIIANAYGDIFFAKLHNKNIAGIMVLYSNNIAHYYFGGSLREYHKYQPNEALLHNAIIRAIEMKKSVFDFMGSDENDTALIHFKQKWGTVRHQTAHYTIVQNAFRHTLWNAGLRILSSSWGTALTRLTQSLRSGQGRA
jgi:GNAT acetyltransferase-like protein